MVGYAWSSSFPVALHPARPLSVAACRKIVTTKTSCACFLDIARASHGTERCLQIHGTHAKVFGRYGGLRQAEVHPFFPASDPTPETDIVTPDRSRSQVIQGIAEPQW